MQDEQPAETLAFVRNSTVVAVGAVRITAISEAQIDASAGNDATSAPAAFLGAGGMSASAMLTSNMVSSAVRAFVQAGSVTSTDGLEVLATDAAAIRATSDLLATVSPTNDLGGGIINGWAQAIRDDYAFTSNSGSRPVRFGDQIRVADDYDGPDADADTDAEAGLVFQFMGTDRGLDLGAQDYSDFELFKERTPTAIITDTVSYAILSHVGAKLGNDGLAGSADSYYGLIDRNDVRSAVEAYVSGAIVRSAGDVLVAALADARLSAADSSAIGTWDGFGGMIATNLVLAHAHAWMQNADVQTTGGASVTVDAAHVSVIDASITSKIEAWTAISGVAAFNSVGWKSSNLLFNAIEALFGDPVLSELAFDGEQPAEARAWIADSALAVDGDLTISATSAAQITAVAGNENIAEAALDIVFGSSAQAKGVAGGGILASNKVSSAAHASLGFSGGRGDADVGGTLTVAAQDSAGIDVTRDRRPAGADVEHARRPRERRQRLPAARRLRLHDGLRRALAVAGRPRARRRDERDRRLRRRLPLHRLRR